MSFNYQSLVRDSISGQISGLEVLRKNLEMDIDSIMSIFSSSRIVVTGVGKSGLIGAKIAATLSSTGTSSIFLHPTEALHGDLGSVGSNDVILAISNSGETEELLKIMPFFKSNGNLVVAVTAHKNSTLAKLANATVYIGGAEEVCPLNLAPTTSTTMTLVAGDVIAICLMQMKGFTEKDFARFHPGGSLGRRLLHKVEDEMICDNLPLANLNASGEDVVNIISSGSLGLCCIENEMGEIVGMITDGDLRRSIQKYKSEFFTTNVKYIMSINPNMISADCMVADAWQLMDDKKITSLLVVDENKKLRGILKK
jgi:arabinose-5-phosphate isomerase